MPATVIAVPQQVHLSITKVQDLARQIGHGGSPFSSAKTLEDGPQHTAEVSASARSWRQSWRKTTANTPRGKERPPSQKRRPEDHAEFAEYVKSICNISKRDNVVNLTDGRLNLQSGAMHGVSQGRQRRKTGRVPVQAVLVCWEEDGAYRIEPLPILKQNAKLGQLFAQINRLWVEYGPWWVHYWPFTTLWIKEVEISAPHLNESRFEAEVSQVCPIGEDLAAVDSALKELESIDRDGDCPRVLNYELDWNGEPCTCEYCNFERLLYRRRGLQGMTELAQAFQRPDRFYEKDLGHSRLYKAGTRHDELTAKSLIHDFENTESAMEWHRWPKAGYLIHYQTRPPKNPTEWAVAGSIVLVALVLAFVVLWAICTVMPDRFQEGGSLAIALAGLLISVVLPWLTYRLNSQTIKEKSH